MRSARLSADPLGRTIMRFDRQAFQRVFSIVLLLEAVAFAVVFVPRSPLTEDQWQFLEKQRPKRYVPGELMDLAVCADCLDFAVFRRGIGGWETPAANVLQLVNQPAFSAATEVFSDIRWQIGSTSKQQSDLATIVLVALAAVECALVSLVFSVRVQTRRAA